MMAWLFGYTENRLYVPTARENTVRLLFALHERGK